MDKETFGSLLGLLVTLAGIIKLLIDAYFKKADEHEALKNSYTENQITELRKIVNHISATVEHFKKEIENQIEKTRSLHQSLNGFVAVLKSYVEVNTKKTDDMKSEIIQIKKDLIIIKNKRG